MGEFDYKLCTLDYCGCKTLPIFMDLTTGQVVILHGFERRAGDSIKRICAELTYYYIGEL